MLAKAVITQLNVFDQIYHKCRLIGKQQQSTHAKTNMFATFNSVKIPSVFPHAAWLIMGPLNTVTVPLFDYPPRLLYLPTQAVPNQGINMWMYLNIDKHSCLFFRDHHHSSFDVSSNSDHRCQSFRTAQHITNIKIRATVGWLCPIIKFRRQFTRSSRDHHWI